MITFNHSKGISIIEALVSIVIIGIGFIAIMQLSAFTMGSIDRVTEKNKLNYLSEMVMEDMIADPDNASKYNGFNKTCSTGNQTSTDLQTKMKKKWDDMLQEKSLIQINNKERQPMCDSKDSKKAFVTTGANATGRVNFLTGKGERKKYLGVVVK